MLNGFDLPIARVEIGSPHEMRAVPTSDLVCEPCNITLMRATAGQARRSLAVETIVLCPNCGTKLRWR